MGSGVRIPGTSDFTIKFSRMYADCKPALDQSGGLWSTPSRGSNPPPNSFLREEPLLNRGSVKRLQMINKKRNHLIADFAVSTWKVLIYSRFLVNCNVSVIFSSRVSELLGYTAEELTGKNLYALCHGEDANKLRKCHVDCKYRCPILSIILF